MAQADHTLSITPPSEMPKMQRVGLGITAVGILALLVSAVGNSTTPVLPLLFGGFLLVTGGILAARKSAISRMGIVILLIMGLVCGSFFTMGPWALDETVSWIWFAVVIGLLAVGSIWFFKQRYGNQPAGIRNDGIQHSTVTKKYGGLAWVLAVVITGFYALLYFFPQFLHGLIALVDPLNIALTGNSGLPNGSQGYSPWFMYGFFYTVAILLMGIRFAYKYRHNRYQLIRTGSVTFFQLFLAFLIPNIMARLNGQAFYFTYFWPLDYDILFPSSIESLTNGGGWAHFMLWWTVFLSIPGVVILTYFFGKRWYCSWVCGCGGLAETAGDPFRHLSDKSLKAWQVERVLIHSVLVAITAITVALLINWQFPFLPGHIAGGLKTGYGFIIGAVFAGVIGVGFYPIMGSRVWCRFGCPQAAILGILQKYFSRFRITTNGGQCISCGNCSTYCEMGIDVKWYAQREQNIVRSSCVGCGICSAVCPRGVLNLESGPIKNKTVIQIDREDVSILEP